MIETRELKSCHNRKVDAQSTPGTSAWPKTVCWKTGAYPHRMPSQPPQLVTALKRFQMEGQRVAWPFLPFRSVPALTSPWPTGPFHTANAQMLRVYRRNPHSSSAQGSRSRGENVWLMRLSTATAQDMPQITVAWIPKLFFVLSALTLRPAPTQRRDTGSCFFRQRRNNGGRNRYKVREINMAIALRQLYPK